METVLPQLGNSTDLKDTSTTNQKMSSSSGIVLACSMAAFAFIVLALVAVLQRRHRRRRVRAAVERRLAAGRNDEQKRIERYAVIERWLVSKRVVAHDERLCSSRVNGQSNVSGDENGKSGTKMKRKDTLETIADIELASCCSSCEGQECSICFEAIGVGDIVSWSVHRECGHVYHHRCIKSWLLEKTDCPYCRATFLPPDEVEDELSMRALPDLIAAGQRRRQPMCYCVEHGVVECNQSHTTLLTRINPSRKELEALRDCEQVSLEETGDLNRPVTVDEEEEDLPATEVQEEEEMRPNFWPHV